MALKFDSLEELKQIFKEAEENENKQQETQQNINSIKAQRLHLEQQKQQHKQKIDNAKLAILQAREEAKSKQLEKQRKQDNAVYLLSIIIAFATFATTTIFFICLLCIY